MSLSPAPRQFLVEAAQILLQHAREETERGFQKDDRVYLMDAAEKAWNAVCHAVDALMLKHGRQPAVGRDAHVTRSEFLEQIGRHDLSMEYSYFSERLHGAFFNEGRVPQTRTEMNRRLREVADFLQQTTNYH